MSIINPLAFINKIEKQPPFACLLCGEETQLLEEMRAGVCRHFNGDNRHFIDLDKIRTKDEISYQSNGLFSSSAELFQLYAVGKPSASGLTFIEKIHKCLQPPNCLMIILSEWDYKYKKAAWFRNLADTIPTVLCSRISPLEAEKWNVRWAAQAQVSLSKDALHFLNNQTEGNLFAAKQAIVKLSLVTGGQVANKQMVRRVLADGARYDIFDLVDAIYAGAPARAISILRHLRNDNVADTLIQWSVFNVLNNIAAAQRGGRVLAWGEQLGAVKQLAEKINDCTLHYLLRQAAHVDRSTKGVAAGDSEDILCGIVTRLAALQRDVKITLPYFQPEA